MNVTQIFSIVMLLLIMAHMNLIKIYTWPVRMAGRGLPTLLLIEVSDGP